MKSFDFIKQAQAWLGKNEYDGSHKEIIDIYNSQKPLPVGYKVKYTDQWCATFVSAVAVQCKCTDIVPPECSCPRMISLFQKMGRWEENENRIPKSGDIIFYDWQDNGIGDNKGNADHVGIVEKVIGNTITVIEGNYHKSVSRREIEINNRYIRGYGIPAYESNFSDGWQKDEKGWFFVKNGEKILNEWVEDNLGWCYVDSEGYLVTNNWQKDTLHWYYLDETGHFTHNKWVKDSIDWCYLDKDGWMATNTWVKDSDGWCYLKNDGHILRNGWASDSMGKHYLDNSGHLAE